MEVDFEEPLRVKRHCLSSKCYMYVPMSLWGECGVHLMSDGFGTLKTSDLENHEGHECPFWLRC